MESNALDEIRFDLEKHRCFKGKESLSAVGTILKKAAKVFDPWSKDEKTPESQARMDRGIMIHQVLELYDKGTLGKYDPMVEGHLTAWKAINRHFGVMKWSSIEEAAADPVRNFWGVPDRFEPGLPLVEIKTGSARPVQYRIQTAAYCILKKVEAGVVVYVSDSGIFDPVKDIETVTARDFELFEMALKLSRSNA